MFQLLFRSVVTHIGRATPDQNILGWFASHAGCFSADIYHVYISVVVVTGLSKAWCFAKLSMVVYTIGVFRKEEGIVSQLQVSVCY